MQASVTHCVFAHGSCRAAKREPESLVYDLFVRWSLWLACVCVCCQSNLVGFSLVDPLGVAL